MVALIEGEEAECRTRLTSLVPSADHKSTDKTKYVVSISLPRVSICSPPIGSAGSDGLNTYLMSSGCPVLTSVTVNKMHGGGVIGLRS